MELTFSEIKKREVINVSEGRSLGFPIDLTIDFPSGKLAGITAQGRKVCFLIRPFIKSDVYIPVSKIVKIGNDVILVNLKCGDICATSTPIGGKTPSGGLCNQIFNDDE